MTKASKNEGREFTRCRVKVKGEVRLPSGVLLEGQTQDISLKGIWFATERSLPIGNEVKVCLVLSSENENYHIETLGRVVRVDQGGVGIEFTEIDSDSIEHLRKLVLYNAQDADIVHDEFDAHLGLRPKNA